MQNIGLDAVKEGASVSKASLYSFMVMPNSIHNQDFTSLVQNTSQKESPRNMDLNHTLMSPNEWTHSSGSAAQLKDRSRT